MANEAPEQPALFVNQRNCSGLPIGDEALTLIVWLGATVVAEADPPETTGVTTEGPGAASRFVAEMFAAAVCPAVTITLLATPRKMAWPLRMI